MANKVRVGVLGMTHDHVWSNLRDLVASADGELVAAADPHAELRDKVQREFDCKHVFASYDEMLDTVELDAVYIFSDNATGADLSVKASEHGLHVMVEKPMASTLGGAVRMLAAARNAGKLLMVNWPFAWMPALQKAMEMAHAGEIGRVWSTRYRAAHGGPKELGCTPFFYNWLHNPDLNGAGALMDYCCYGAALARYMLGQPSRVMGMAGHLQKDYVTVDDNAIIMMQWPRAMAITEGCWIQQGHLTSYVAVIYGSEGTLMVDRRSNGPLLFATAEKDDGVPVDVPEPPAEMRNASAYFLSRIVNNLPIEGICAAEVGRDAQEILEAGLMSALNNEAVSLPLPVY